MPVDELIAVALVAVVVFIMPVDELIAVALVAVVLVVAVVGATGAPLPLLLLIMGCLCFIAVRLFSTFTCSA